MAGHDNCIINSDMVFDVEIIEGGTLYVCGLMERQTNDHTWFSVDIRIPGHGDTLNEQINDLELHIDPNTGRFKFRNAPPDSPASLIALEEKLNDAIQNLGK